MRSEALITSTRTNLTLLAGTTKGAFLICGGNDRSGWAIQGPYCDGWPINHVVGDPETGTLWAGGGGEWHGAGIWCSKDGGTNWKVTRLTKGKMDDWAEKVDASLETGLSRAYHRHMATFCSQFPGRLKGLIRAPARDVGAAVEEIRKWGNSDWAVAVQPSLGQDIPADHPDLEPIWRAAADHDLPIVHHSSTWNPPYYPGYRDVWDNIFIGRLASHPWGAMRFVASFIGGGILDRYPGLRLGVLECGFGWLPFWGRRMDEQYAYVGSTAALNRKPSEYLTSGRFFCSIERQEGEDMFTMVTDFLGDGVLMYASDYPHSECQFPDSVDNVLAWKSLGSEMREKLFWGNAARFFKQS